MRKEQSRVMLAQSRPRAFDCKKSVRHCISVGGAAGSEQPGQHVLHERHSAVPPLCPRTTRRAQTVRVMLNSSQSDEVAENILQCCPMQNWERIANKLILSLQLKCADFFSLMCFLPFLFSFSGGMMTMGNIGADQSITAGQETFQVPFVLHERKHSS